MSVSYTCDWCGEPIESDRGSEYGEAHLSATGLYEDYGLAFEEVGHFHVGRFRDGDSCLLQAIRLVREHFGTMSRVVSDEQEEREERKRNHCAWREARGRWDAALRDERERWVLQALGDDRLTASELAARIQVNENAIPSAGDARRVALQMAAAGELDASKEAFRSRGRYRFSRRRALEGPIADLERAFAIRPFVRRDQL